MRYIIGDKIIFKNEHSKIISGTILKIISKCYYIVEHRYNAYGIHTSEIIKDIQITRNGRLEKILEILK